MKKVLFLEVYLNGLLIPRKDTRVVGLILQKSLPSHKYFKDLYTTIFILLED